MKLKIALVGPGAIGERHLTALRLAGGQVEAVVGVDLQEAAAFAAAEGIPRAYSQLAEALDDPQIEAVVIASPSPLHAEQARMVLQSGRPVLCEIPAALSLAEAIELDQLSRESGRQLMVAHTNRFAEPYRGVREVISDGRFEARHVVFTQFFHRQVNVGWTGRQRTWTDDVLWHHGGHLVDLALWFLDATDVVVHGRSGPVWAGNGTHMDVAAVLEAPDGDLATVSLSYHSRRPVDQQLIIGEDHTYAIEGSILIEDGRPILDAGEHDAMMRRAMVVQAQEFLDAVAEGRPPSVGIAEILPTMVVLDQLQTAGRVR